MNKDKVTTIKKITIDKQDKDEMNKEFRFCFSKSENIKDYYNIYNRFVQLYFNFLIVVVDQHKQLCYDYDVKNIKGKISDETNDHVNKIFLNINSNYKDIFSLSIDFDKKNETNSANKEHILNHILNMTTDQHDHDHQDVDVIEEITDFLKSEQYVVEITLKMNFINVPNMNDIKVFRPIKYQHTLLYKYFYDFKYELPDRKYLMLIPFFEPE